MRNIVKEADFDFEYAGSSLTEKDAIDKNFIQLVGQKLLSRIRNVRVFGDYLMGYKFVTDIYEDGRTEGVNNVGSHDFGYWIVDLERHTLSLKWNNGWSDTTTRAYDVNGNIEFYDVDTGNWRTTFRRVETWKEE